MTYVNPREAQAVFLVVENLNCVFATWNMSHIELSLMRLNKDDFLRMWLDYQKKFNNILDELKNSLNELETKFYKLESDLHISRNVNDKLSYKLIVLKQKCHTVKMNSTPKENALKSRAFLLEWGVKTLKEKVLEVVDAI